LNTSLYHLTTHILVEFFVFFLYHGSTWYILICWLLLYFPSTSNLDLETHLNFSKWIISIFRIMAVNIKRTTQNKVQQIERNTNTFLSFVFLPVWCSWGFLRLVFTFFYKIYPNCW
jgi:hypothetical protein